MIRKKEKISTFLSKSLYIKGLQCHKALYLHKHFPDLRDEITEAQEALFQQGYDVGEYAQRLFPGGVEIPYEENNYEGQVEKTRSEIEKGTKTIYEATFSYDDVFVKIDILKKGRRGWNIYEVKSGTSLKDVYLNDTAIQYYVAKGSGLNISKAAAVYINKHYVKAGEIEPKKLFVVDDVTDAVEKMQTAVSANVSALKGMLLEAMPDIDIGEHCDDPYGCDFHGHCWRHIPEDSVFDLRQRGVDQFALYQEGIINMRDIPLDRLNRSQRMQVEAFCKKAEMIDSAAIKNFCETLWYPLYFLDFETIYTPIPLFNGTKPYQQVPVQYSLHYQESEKGDLLHTEFIAAPGKDPRKELAEKLIRDIPEDACVLSYTDFEIRRMSDLATWFPRYAKKLNRIIDNVRDLAVPFRSRDYYHWKQNGSASLKDVLPALIPAMNYDHLEIQDGGMAVDAFLRMNASNDPVEIEAIRRALLEYCKLDTLAMVRILDRLYEMLA